MDTVTFKVTHAGLTRRLTLPVAQLKWNILINKIATSFGRDPSTLNALIYVDEDGDQITMDTDQELQALWMDAALHGKPMPRLLLPDSSNADTQDWVLANAAEKTASSDQTSSSAMSECAASVVSEPSSVDETRTTASSNQEQTAVPPSDGSSVADEANGSPVADGANASSTTIPTTADVSNTAESSTHTETSPVVPSPIDTNTTSPDTPNTAPESIPKKPPVLESSSSDEDVDSSSDESDTETIDPAEHPLPPLSAQIRELAHEFVNNVRSDTELSNNAHQIVDQTLCLVQQSTLMLFDTLRAEIAHANNSTASGRQGRTRGTHASSLSAMAQNLQRHAAEFTRTAQRGIDLLNERAQTRGTSIAHATQEQAIHLVRVAQQQATIIAEQAMQHLNRLQQRTDSNEASTPEPGYRPPSPIRTNCTPNMPMNLSEETRLNMPRNLPEETRPNMPMNLSEETRLNMPMNLSEETRSNMPRDLTEEITDMPMNIPEAAIPYATQFQQLREMGYTDERRLIRYLRLFDGDVTSVVDSMESAFNIDSDDDDGLYN